VIVLWSSDSVESSWVRAEAEVAMKKGQLIPALLETVDIPLVFRQFQAASLSDWNGDINHPGFQQLLHAISALLPPPDHIEPAPHTTQPPSKTPETFESIDTGDASATSDSTTTPRPIAPEQPAHSRFNIAAWALVFILAGALGYSIFYPKEQTTPPAVIPQSSEPQTQTSAVEPSVTVKEHPQPEKTAQTAQVPALPEPEKAPAKIIPAEPIKTPAPSTAKPRPTPVAPSTKGASTDTQQSSPPQPAVPITPPPAKAAAPLAVLIVTWAMPSDTGVASTARIEDFSSNVAKTLSTSLQDVLSKPVDFDYFYPSQNEYYRLLKDKDGYAEYQALCNSHKTTLVISGFIKGANFVSASYGYELTRDPVYSVFDCTNKKKITQSYKISESNQDNFPYEESIRKTFRDFVQNKAALNTY